MNRFLLQFTLAAVACVPMLVATAAAQPPAYYSVPASKPSAASKFSSSVKNGFSKVTGALIPHTTTHRAPDPISLSVPAKPSPDFHVAVARMAEESGNLAKAEFHYRQALELDEKHFDALKGYAHMLDRQGKFPEAIELYRLAVQIRPSDPAAHNDLGICFARNGRLDEAVTSLEKAVQLQPKQPRYRNNLATVLVQTKRIDEAFSHLKVVHPKAVAYYNLGYLLQKAGDKRGAARLFEEAVATDPSLTEARAWLQQVGPSAPTPTPRKQPQAIARRPAPQPPVLVPPTSPAPPRAERISTAPMPPQSQPAPQTDVRNQVAPRHLAPLPSIKPLPPVQNTY